MATTSSYNISESLTTLGNMSGYAWHPQASIYTVVLRMQTVLLPIIIFVGISGNCLAVGAFFSKSLRKTSCCLYLGAKSISDLFFLVSLFVFFLHRVHVTLLNHQGVCQITVFLTYFCPFMSVWLVVIITFENFIRISQPALVPTICTTAAAKSVIICYVVVGLAVYNFPFWTTRIMNNQCLSATEFDHIVQAFTYVDTFLTLVFPLAIMLVLVPLVAISALSAFKRKERLMEGKKRKKSSFSPEAQVTRMLFAVSVIFFVLHTPGHSIRIKEMIVQMSFNMHPTFQDQILQRIFEIVHYLDFCVSLAVYLVFGRNFRKVFVSMYFKRCSSKSQSVAL